MIAPLLALAVPTLGVLARQELPEHGCAAFLWNAGTAKLAAMASADPARLRIVLDDAAPVDLPRVAQQGEGGFGLAGTTTYRGGDVTATLALTIATRADLRDGAAVPQATLSIARPAQDVLVVPLAGLIGCRTPG